MWKKAVKNGYNKLLNPIIPQLRPTQLASIETVRARIMASFVSIEFELSKSKFVSSFEE